MRLRIAVSVLTFYNQNQANLAVSTGRADVGFADSQVAAYIVHLSNGQFKLTGVPFSTAPYGFAVAKNSGLAKPLLSAVKALMVTGSTRNPRQVGSSAGGRYHPQDQRRHRARAPARPARLGD